jgi:hypothetical protein
LPSAKLEIQIWSASAVGQRGIESAPQVACAARQGNPLRRTRTRKPVSLSSPSSKIIQISYLQCRKNMFAT